MCKLHIMLHLLDPLLAPLSRLLLARGVLFRDFSERMKAHYVEAAIAQATGKVTDSKISVLTGLQRRDIARQRDFTPAKPRPNHLARLVAMWQTNSAYQENGRPRPLPRGGDAPSFETLARLVRQDVHPRTMLDALEAAGTVSVVSDLEIRLLERSYQPLKGSDEQIDYLAKNTGDHLNAASENVLGQTPPHFERAVHYTGLTEEQVGTLRRVFHDAQMDLLRELSQKAAEMKKQNDSTAQQRFRAGGFFFEQKENRP